MTWLILLIEISIIFLTSRFIFKAFFVLIYLLFHSQKIAVAFISFFFFPGVVIHELSHLLTAEVLGVKTHGVDLFPELHEGRLKMGSVKVERSDFFRQFLIGVAPFISGLGILLGVFYLVFQAFTIPLLTASVFNIFLSAITLYFVFVITNTMFSSKKDMDGAVELLIVLLILYGICLLFGFHIERVIQKVIFLPDVTRIIDQIIYFLLPPVSLNIIAVVVFFGIFNKKGIHIK